MVNVTRLSYNVYMTTRKFTKKSEVQNCCVSFIINYCFLKFTMQLPSYFHTKKVPNLGQALAKQPQRERTDVYKRAVAMF